ncbi:MAG: hypothetical protein V9H69_18230 [Anaerolineae bacterium]
MDVHYRDADSGFFVASLLRGKEIIPVVGTAIFLAAGAAGDDLRRLDRPPALWPAVQSVQRGSDRPGQRDAGAPGQRLLEGRQDRHG